MEMEEEVEEGKRNKKRQPRTKIKRRTGIETEERRAGEREKMERIRECKVEKRMRREKLREEMEEGSETCHPMERERNRE